MNPPLLFLAAGEVSGDGHGAALARALQALVPGLRLVGWGSHKMAAAGVELLEDLTPHAAVGLTENLAALKPAREALARARAYFAEHKPSAAVLIDYQGANMQLARHARELGMKTIYYISPQEWIWGFKSGPRKVASQVDLILAIFAREGEVYREAGGNVRFVGHPLLDQVPSPARIDEVRRQLGLQGPVLGLFPGSRKVEIARLLPLMLETAALLKKERPELEVLLPVASPHFEAQLTGVQGVRVVKEASGIEVLGLSSAALVASGTVTLEAAVVGTPVVATYRVSALTAFLARKVFKIGHVTLPNIVAGHGVVPELLQEQSNPASLAAALRPLLEGGDERDRQLAGLAEVRQKLGGPGATQRAAEAIAREVNLPMAVGR